MTQLQLIRSHSDTPTLRPYQSECIAAIIEAKHKRKALVVLPTGSGKTVIFSAFAKKCHDFNGHVLVIVQKNTLVRQTVASLERYIDDVAVYNAGMRQKRFGQITVASIQSLNHANVIPEFNVVLFDEAHRYHKKILEQFANAFVIGFTATPWRENAPIWGGDNFFNEVTYQRQIKDMVDLGYLVPPRYFAHKAGIDFDLSRVKKNREDYILSDLNNVILDQTDKIQAQVEDALSRSNGHEKIIVLTTSIGHATLVHSMLDNASIVHSQQSDKERLINFDDFTQGPVRFLVSVLIASEGFDFPAATMLWFMRPTRSTVLYLQAVGRVLRPYTNKECGVILDYGQVVTNLGDIEDAFDNACKKQKKKNDEQKQRLCFHCFCYACNDENACPSCGEPFVIKCNKCGEFYNKGAKCGCAVEVDRFKNLTDQAWSDLVELQEFEIDRNYISKKGNQCFKIVFKFAGFSCWEYFVKSNAWSMAKFRSWTKVLLSEDEDLGAFSKWLSSHDQSTFKRVSITVQALLIKQNGYKKVSDVFRN